MRLPGRRAMASGEQGRRTAWNWVLRGISLIIAAGLAVDAFVHFDLTSTYAETGGAISEGTLFRAEAVVALVTAHAVVLTRHRACYLLAFGVAASALTAMIVSRYADLGPIGPFPDLYDPAWFPEKVLAA